MFELIEEEIDRVERHLDVLAGVREAGPVGIPTLSERTAYPRHKVRTSLRKLEVAGAVDRTPRGAVITDDTPGFLRRCERRRDRLEDRLRRLTAGPVVPA